MTVDNTIHIGTRLIDLQMQPNLTTRCLCSTYAAALQIDHAQVGRFQESLALHRGRAKNLVVALSHGDITVVGGSKSAAIKPIAYLTDDEPLVVDVHAALPYQV